MSQFALFYNADDQNAVIAAFNNAGLSAADKATAISWLNAGLATVSHTAAPAPWNTDAEVVVVTDALRTATDFLTFLQQLASQYGSTYMNAVAADMQSALDQAATATADRGCQDPYP